MCCGLPVRKARKRISKLGIISRVTATQQRLTCFFEARWGWGQGCSCGAASLGSAIHIASPGLQPSARHQDVACFWLQVEGCAGSQVWCLHALLLSLRCKNLHQPVQKATTGLVSRGHALAYALTCAYMAGCKTEGRWTRAGGQINCCFGC